MNPKNLCEARIFLDENLNNKAFIKGSSVSVAQILFELYQEKEEVAILRKYYGIRLEDIKAAQAYAFCISEQISLELRNDKGKVKKIETNLEETIQVESQRQASFYTSLEKSAKNQKKFTDKYVEELKRQKRAGHRKITASEAATSDADFKEKAPQKKAYDLMIDLNPNEKFKIFTDKDPLEQSLDMSFDNYIFQKRSDGQLWLTYSVKDDVEIDKAMKRNLKVSFHQRDENNQALLEKDKISGIYEGYLTTDRKSKIFLAKSDDGRVCGRAL